MSRVVAIQMITPFSLQIEGQTIKDTLTVTFFPDRVTKEDIALYTSTGTGMEKYNEQVNAMLVRLIHSWDVLEDDGVTPVPLTPLRMMELPLNLKEYIWRGIIDCMQLPLTIKQ
jgi:hypothetical protein